MTNVKTTHLQYVGDVPAVEASELKAGDVRMYNGAATGLIIKVIEKSTKTLTLITYENGKYFMSDIRKSTLVAIVKRDQDVTEHKPQQAYNVSGKEKGMVDVSEYFPTEERQLEVYHMELQERGMALTSTKPEVKEGSEYKVIVSVDRDTNQVGEFEKVVTGKELDFILFMNEVLEIVEEIKSEDDYNSEPVEVIESVEQRSQEQNEIVVTMSINEEMNGIELTFTDKPNEELRSQLKSNGFRWSKRDFWYAKQTNERLRYAESLTGSAITETHNNNKPQEISYPGIEINDLESGLYSIPQDLQDREHEANWITRSQKRDHNKELIDLFTGIQNQVIEVIGTTDNDYYIYKLKQSLQRFKKNYHATYVKHLSQKASTPSWIVTGRGGLNASRYNKKMEQQNKTLSELVSLPKEMERTIIKYRNKIRREQKSA